MIKLALVKRRGVLLVAVSIAVLGSVGAAIAENQGDEPGPTRPQAQTVNSAASERFGLLRGPKGPDDVLPDRAVAAISHGEKQYNGANSGLARGAGTFEQGRIRMWLVPGTDGLCTEIVIGGFESGGCASQEAADAGRLFGVESGAAVGGTVMDGAIPDGVKVVTVRLADGSTQDIQVRNNLYAAFVPADPVALVWDGPDGAHHDGPLFSQGN